MRRSGRAGSRPSKSQFICAYSGQLRLTAPTAGRSGARPAVGLSDWADQANAGRFSSVEPDVPRGHASPASPRWRPLDPSVASRPVTRRCGVYLPRVQGSPEPLVQEASDRVHLHQQRAKLGVAERLLPAAFRHIRPLNVLAGRSLISRHFGLLSPSAPSGGLPTSQRGAQWLAILPFIQKALVICVRAQILD